MAEQGSTQANSSLYPPLHSTAPLAPVFSRHDENKRASLSQLVSDTGSVLQGWGFHQRSPMFNIINPNEFWKSSRWFIPTTQKTLSSWRTSCSGSYMERTVTCSKYFWKVKGRMANSSLDFAKIGFIFWPGWEHFLWNKGRKKAWFECSRESQSFEELSSKEEQRNKW